MTVVRQTEGEGEVLGSPSGAAVRHVHPVRHVGRGVGHRDRRRASRRSAPSERPGPTRRSRRAPSPSRSAYSRIARKAWAFAEARSPRRSAHRRRRRRPAPRSPSAATKTVSTRARSAGAIAATTSAAAWITSVDAARPRSPRPRAARSATAPARARCRRRRPCVRTPSSRRTSTGVRSRHRDRDRSRQARSAPSHRGSKAPSRVELQLPPRRGAATFVPSPTSARRITWRGPSCSSPLTSTARAPKTGV